jgi:hypothetical protein
MIGMEYKRATNEDVESIVDLMNTHAYKDSDKIVIVPEQFRTGYVQSAVDAGRLFVATHDQKIIGYKKLFCVTDTHELNDILSNELRCKGSAPVACGKSVVDDLSCRSISSDAITQLLSSPVTYIYNGADYSHPQYRGRGVNSQLTAYALNAVSQAVIEHINDHKSTHLAIAYGLTRSNAGQESNLLDGRTHGIIKQFIPHASLVADAVNVVLPKSILLSRHHAFKPSFDPKDTECKPLPDDQAIPGYGCLMACALQQKTQ